MAWKVPRTAITPQHEAVISQHLWLQPKNSYAADSDTELGRFRAFTTDADYVYLPFFFGRLLIPQAVPRPVALAMTPPWGFLGQLRPHQTNLVSGVTQQLYQYGTSSLNAYCSAGKTVMAIWCAAWLNQLTAAKKQRAPIIIAYTIELLETQWLDTVKNFSNATVYVVRWANGQADRIPLNCDIYLCMMESLPKLPALVRQSCQMLILDEAHLFCTAHRLEKLLSVEPSTILLLTATPIKPNGMEVVLQLLGGVHAVKLGANVPFTLWRCNTGLKPPLVFNAQGKPDWNAMVDWLVAQEARDQLILEWVRLNPTRKFALITTRTEQAQKLHRDLLQRGESASILVGQAKNYQRCRVLVLGVKKGGVGFDEASSCADFQPGEKRIDTVILCISLKALFEQAIGRSFRASNPHIIYLVDNSPIIQKHWKLAEAWALAPDRQGQGSIETTNQAITLPFEFDAKEASRQDAGAVDDAGASEAGAVEAEAADAGQDIEQDNNFNQDTT